MKNFDIHSQQVKKTISKLQSLIDNLQDLEESFLKQQEALYIISEFANDWEYWQDEDGTYRYVSPSCEKITGYTPDDFYHNKELLKKIIKQEDWKKWKNHSHTLAKNNQVEPLEFEIHTRCGNTKWIHHVCRTVCNSDGENIGIRGSNRDISELKLLQEKLQHVAGHDHLTGLANRSLLMEYLQQSLKKAKRRKHMFVVAFIDLDEFKEINDKYGHDAGDHVLKRVAGELLEIGRKEDIVARFGGDEFVAIFQISDQDDVGTIREKLLSKITREIKCHTFQISIRLSIGLSVYPDDGTTIDTLLNKADKAMYAMKMKNKANRK